MKKLIVNADDYGYTPGVVDGILKAHHEGVVTSTTILINSPHLEAALAKLKSAPKLDLGLHLNITWGKPVSSPDKVRSLIGENGNFIRRTQFEDVDLDEVGLEWRAQVAKARGQNIKLTHLDTHHHTHRHPALLDIIAEIAGEEKLAVRSQEPWIRDYLRANHIPTPDYFIEDFYGEGKTTLTHLEDLLRFIPDGFTEVCCHPAIVDEELRKTSSYNNPRNEELAVLTSPELKSWLAEDKITPGVFPELPTPTGAPDKSCELKPEV